MAASPMPSLKVMPSNGFVAPCSMSCAVWTGDPANCDSRYTAIIRRSVNCTIVWGAPSEQELATALDCSVDEVRQLSYASQAEALQSLEEWLENGGKAPTTESDDVDMAMTISKVLATLDKREQLLLSSITSKSST